LADFIAITGNADTDPNEDDNHDEPEDEFKENEFELHRVVHLFSVYPWEIRLYQFRPFVVCPIGRAAFLCYGAIPSGID
jgi:hypothetical protein